MLVERCSIRTERSSLIVTSVTDLAPASLLSRPCGMPGIYDNMKTCLDRFDNNKYSVAASAVGRPVEIRAYANRIEIRQDGRIVGEHRRCFGRDQTIFDPWHYVPVLARKPGALRNLLAESIFQRESAPVEPVGFKLEGTDVYQGLIVDVIILAKDCPIEVRTI